MAEKKSDVMTVTQENQKRDEDQVRQAGQSRQGEQSRQSGQARQEGGLSRREQMPMFPSPFALLQRFADGIAGVFEEAASRDRALSPRAGASDMTASGAMWVPKVDVFQRGNELVVRADLPGMKPEDVVVEIGDDAITISGERQQEQAEERGGVYRFERSYGAFLRAIPLPEGAMADQAKASFNDGVLEVTVPAPPEQVSRGRRLDISQGKEQGKDAKSAKS